MVVVASGKVSTEPSLHPDMSLLNQLAGTWSILYFHCERAGIG